MRKRENRFLKICITASVVLILAVTAGFVGMIRGTVSVSEESATGSENEVAPVFQETAVEEKEISDKYYYSTLNDEEKQIYSEILIGIRENKKVIRIETVNASAVNRIYEFVLNDFPEIFWCSGAAKTTAYQVKEGGYSEFCPEYSYESKAKEQMQEEIDRETEDFLEDSKLTQLYSDYEKIKYVYEYVVQSVDYVSDAKDSQNLYSALVNKESVCAGYARETQYLLEKLGVFCTYVTGETKGQPHAWNLVKCDGNYYYVDSTWGDPVFLQSDGVEIPKEQQIQYDYLCCSEEELFRTHTLSGEISFPLCTSVRDNYYVKEGCYYQRYDEDRMSKQLNGAISQKEKVTVFKFSNQEAYEESREQLLKKMIPASASDLARQYKLDKAKYSYQDDSVLYKISVYWQYE